MTSDDAFILAQRIEKTVPGMQVMAVGRFVAPEEINGSTPWKISVAIAGVEKPKMVADENSLADLILWVSDQQQKPADCLF